LRKGFSMAAAFCNREFALSEPRLDAEADAGQSIADLATASGRTELSHIAVQQYLQNSPC
jgi:hypothetical protein